MTTTLSKSVVITPAVPAVTVTTFDLVDVQENYGYQAESGNRGRGSQNSVQATIVFSAEPPIYRTMDVWAGEEYLAVRGTWTDDTLRARIKEILEAE